MCNALLLQLNHQAKREVFTKICEQGSFYSQCFTATLSLKAHLKFLTATTIERVAALVIKNSWKEIFFFHFFQQVFHRQGEPKRLCNRQVSKPNSGYRRFCLLMTQILCLHSHNSTAQWLCRDSNICMKRWEQQLERQTNRIRGTCLIRVPAPQRSNEHCGIKVPGSGPAPDKGLLLQSKLYVHRLPTFGVIPVFSLPSAHSFIAAQLKGEESLLTPPSVLLSDHLDAPDSVVSTCMLAS